MNFGKTIWQELKDDEYGFSPINRGEGVIKPLDSGANFYFHLNGSFSHLELIFGVRYETVNRIVMSAMTGIEGLINFKPTFKNKLVGLFNEKIGDFCSSKEHLGVYCPAQSRVADIETIIRIMDDTCDNYKDMRDINIAIEYVLSKNMLDIGNKFYFPAACIEINNFDLFYRSSKFFRDDQKFRCGLEYDLYIQKLSAMIPN